MDAGPEDDLGLEVAGRLAADLGHDLNNHLSTVLNYSFLVGRAVDHDPALKQYLEELQASAWRAADLVQALRLFAPRRATRRGELDVNAIILAAAPVLRRMLECCALETQLDLRLPVASGTRTELEQVLVGLVIHARHALGCGGTITVATHTLGENGAPGVRVSVRWRASDTIVRAAPPPVSSRPAPRLVVVRRALKRLGARLTRAQDAVHVDLPLAR